MANNADNTIDAAFEELRKEAEANVDKAANYFAELLRGRIPRSRNDRPERGGHTADRIHVKKVGGGHLKIERVVRVPYPWSWNEFGSIHNKANPVVRSTLFENQQRLEDMIAGKE